MDLEIFLKTIPLFSSIPDKQIREISDCFDVIRYKKDQTIFSRGDQSDAMYIVRSGAVCIKENPWAGSSFDVELLRGNFFGEMALISNLPRETGAVVSLDAVLYRLKKEDFGHLVEQNRQIGLFLSRLYARRLLSNPIPATGPLAPAFFTVSATHEGLGLSHFLYSMSFHIATESDKKILVVEPHLEHDYIMAQYELFPMTCPDELMYSILPSHIYLPEDIRWFHHPSGFHVLQVDKGFNQKLGDVLTMLMERFKASYDKVFFSLGTHFGKLEQKTIRLCDKNMLVIKNTEDALFQVKHKLERLEKTAGPGLNRVKAGVSHLIGSKGIPREQLKQALNLSETPQIWIEKSDKARKDQIDTQKRFPIKGARAVAREIAGVRIGLALGAGAARGWSHIGVLKVLEEEGVHVDMIAGTSMGAVVAAIFAAAGSVEKLVDRTIRQSYTRALARKKLFDYTLPFQGLLRGKKALTLVEKAVDGADFMDLLIPTYISAVDLLKGEEVVFETGDVAKAVRSSLSVPGIFVPYLYRNRWMVDGGLLNPVPVNILEQKGADKIIAVCIETPQDTNPDASSGRPGIIKVITRTINIVHGHATGGFAHKSDLVIYPETRDFAWDDFHKGDLLVKRGEQACKNVIDEIRGIKKWSW